MKIQFVGGAYQARSATIDCQECVNYYQENEQPTSKEPTALIGTPGLKLLVELPTSPIRGVYTTSTGRMYAAAGNTIYEITTAYDYTVISTISTVSGAVVFADNGQQVIAVDGQYGYVITLLTNAFVQITDSNFPGSTHVVFIDGRFVGNTPGSGEWRFSESYDGTVWEIDTAQAEGSPDTLLSIQKLNNQIWMFGTQSIEVWYNAGTSPVPYERINSASMTIGTTAKDSPATNGIAIFWLGSNTAGKNVVFMATGYQAQQISTHAIENIISSFVKQDDAIGYCYQQEGHNFYVLNFLTDNRTLVYDMSTGVWHERSNWDRVYGKHLHHRAVCHCTFNNKNIVGDYLNGIIYEYSLDYYTDNGNTIRRERTSPHIHQDMKRILFSSFEVDVERGVSNPSCVDSDAKAMLKWSDDGGMTWSNEYIRSLGKVGKYRESVCWNRLGTSKDRVFRFSVTDPVKSIIVGASISAVAEK
jgi:hypothetical protein